MSVSDKHGRSKTSDGSISGGGKGVTNSLVAVTVAADPGADFQRVIPVGSLTIRNADTATATVTFTVAGGTPQIPIVITLQPGDRYVSDVELSLLGGTDSLTVVLGAAVAANQLPWTVSFVDRLV